MRWVIALSAVGLLAIAMAAGSRPAPAPETAKVLDVQMSDHARDALLPTCGSCHRSDLPTAKAGALAVFDLTKDPWWTTIKAEEYDALLTRVRGTSAIKEEDREAIEAFVALIRPSSPPTPEP